MNLGVASLAHPSPEIVVLHGIHYYSGRNGRVLTYEGSTRDGRSVRETITEIDGQTRRELVVVNTTT